MENINYKQLAFVLGLKKDEAFAKILKMKMLGLRAEAEFTLKEKSSETDKLISATCRVSDYIKAHGIDLQKHLNEIYLGFHKNKTCVDHAIEVVNKKIKQDARGFYPTSVSLPLLLRPLISDEGKKYLRGAVLDFWSGSREDGVISIDGDKHKVFVKI